MIKQADAQREPPGEQDSTPIQRETLNKEISLLTLFSLAFGTIIGVGWITVLGVWLTNAGSVGAMAGFLIGGFIILVIALCYAEIATMFPVSGGEVAYVYEMFGTRTAFAAGWFLLFNYIALTSFEAISVGWILSVLIPGLEGPVLYMILGFEVRLWSLLCGFVIMAIITIINFRGARVSGLFQNAMTFFLLAAALVFVAFGIGSGSTDHITPAFKGNTLTAALTGIAVIVATAPFWYSGFDTIPQAMGELRVNASLQQLPLVITVALVLAAAFYCLVILAASMSLPRASLLKFDLPVARALTAAFDSVWLGKLVLLAGLAGLITTWNAIFFAAARVAFALGRARMIPHTFAHVHPKFGSPAFAVVFVGVVGAVGALLGRNAIVPIVGASSIVLAIIFVLVVTGTIRLRRTHPDAPRPYKAPGGLPYLIFALILAILILAAAVYAVFRGATGLPDEIIALGSWAVLGTAFWLSASRIRREVSEEQRRWLILNQ